MNVEFPENFWWGAATSGPQSEGRFKKGHANVFDYWYEIEPEKFHDHVGPTTASNFYNSYKEDIRLMKEIGLNSVRTSIQWTRLMDDFEKGTVDNDAVTFYNQVIDEFLKNGIRPVLNLHHFDLPIELYRKYGGWESKYVGELFVKFAEKCFGLFSDRVTDWFTFNEPMVIVEGEYLHQFHYPNVIDGPKAVQVAYNLQLASAKTVQKFRQINHNPKGKIGIILNLTPPYPASNSAEDIAASNYADRWLNQFFMKASTKGHFPEKLIEVFKKDGVMFECSSDELALIRENTVDYLGLNYYHPHRVKAPEISPNSLTVDWMPDKYYDEYEMPGRRMNVDKGWEIYPKAIYDIAMDVKNNYGNMEWFISENGMGVSREERYINPQGTIEDDYRIQFIQEHLYWLHKAIEEGANCFGYHLWTPIDCWSWGNAYKNRYGFISNNIQTQVKTIKKSGYWFAEVSKTNKVEIEERILRTLS
ncbi:glycoside hydrolase family 1 protein [Enterococcus gilvus]|uniref:glycoside hydrolase family 1 protein n=1 Tax=Enterococcus gilvus TaxID=160453 RepID=UPI003D6A8294